MAPKSVMLNYCKSPAQLILYIRKLFYW